MKKTFYSYVLREQLTPVLMCLAGAVFVLVTGQLLQLMRILFASSCSVKDIVEIILCAMPRLILYAVPMASLLGVMLGFVRLNSDNELVAFRAAGIGFFGFLPPVSVMLFVITGLSFINAIYVMPATNHAFEQKIRSIGRASIPSLLEEGVFISAIPKLVFFFRSVDHSEYDIKGVFIQDQRQPDEKVTISSETAHIEIPQDANSIIFRLVDGTISRAAKDLKEAQAVGFKTYDFVLAMDDIMGRADNAPRKRSEMNLAEISNKIKTAENREKSVWWSLEMHQRIAFPAACLFLGMLGPPLGSMFRQKGRMTGVTLGVAIFLLYYVMLSACKTLGENFVISPFFAVWTPNILSFALIIYLWTKMQKETPFLLALVARPLASLRLNQPNAGEHEGAVAR
jgi:lipopolysaccharide export system permease protein